MKASKSGQLVFVLAVLFCFTVARRVWPSVPAWQPRFAAETIGIAATFWVVERWFVFQ